MNQLQLRNWARSVLRDPFSTLVDTATAMQILKEQQPMQLITEDDLKWMKTTLMKRLKEYPKAREKLRKILDRVG